MTALPQTSRNTVRPGTSKHTSDIIISLSEPQQQQAEQKQYPRQAGAESDLSDRNPPTPSLSDDEGLMQTYNLPSAEDPSSSLSSAPRKRRRKSRYPAPVVFIQHPDVEVTKKNKKKKNSSSSTMCHEYRQAYLYPDGNSEDTVKQDYCSRLCSKVTVHRRPDKHVRTSKLSFDAGRYTLNDRIPTPYPDTPPRSRSRGYDEYGRHHSRDRAERIVYADRAASASPPRKYSSSYVVHPADEYSHGRSSRGRPIIIDDRPASSSSSSRRNSSASIPLGIDVFKHAVRPTRHDREPRRYYLARPPSASRSRSSHASASPAADPARHRSSTWDNAVPSTAAAYYSSQATPPDSRSSSYSRRRTSSSSAHRSGSEGPQPSYALPPPPAEKQVRFSDPDTRARIDEQNDRIRRRPKIDARRELRPILKNTPGANRRNSVSGYPSLSRSELDQLGAGMRRMSLSGGSGGRSSSLRRPRWEEEAVRYY